MTVLHFASHNVANSATSLQALLHFYSSRSLDILFLQEPPWLNIGLARSLSDPNGTPVQGLPSTPGWRPFLASSTHHQGPRAVTLVRDTLPHGTIGLDSRLSSSRFSVAISIGTAAGLTTLLNCYLPPSSSTYAEEGAIAILGLELPPNPVLTVGDFNRHHRDWSSPGWGQSDHHLALPLTHWLSSQGLTVCNTPGTITRRDPRPNHRSSVIDLLAVSGTLQHSCPDGSLQVYWDRPTASDHAVLEWTWTPLTPLPADPLGPPRMDPSKEEQYRELWEPRLIEAFRLPSSTKADLDRKASAILSAISSSIEELHPEPKTRGNNTQPWWTAECSRLTEALRTAPPHQRHPISALLRRAVTRAKRFYYTRITEEASPDNIWKMAKWGQGSRPAPVASLRRADTTMADDPLSKADTFSSTFFPLPPPITPPMAAPPSPPSAPITPDEVWEALRHTSNTSAPGISGIGYMAVKWVHSSFALEMTQLFNTCLKLGHHPRPWRAAKVVMLRKPNKPDASNPRAYRPITLEETFGKLLEKVIARRLNYHANEGQALPSNQFGTRSLSGVTDASQSLLQDIEWARANHLKTSALAVDVQGFFDKVHPAILYSELRNMQCPEDMLQWVLSFCSDRSVAISFDGFTSPLINKPDLGVPQGSPISPILAALFARSALTLFDRSPNIKIKAYVDDHLLIVFSKTYEQNLHLLTEAYTSLSNHLFTMGLTLDAAKTDLIHFASRNTPSQSFPNISLPATQGAPAVVIQPSPVIRWLGIWWHQKLLWQDHVNRMANKALSALKAIRILANTVRGLSPLLTRRLIIGVIRPILLWGAPVWYTGRSQKRLVLTLQHVMDTAARFLLGVYKGASSPALRFHASLMPLQAYIEKLKSRAAIRTLTLQRPPLSWPRFTRQKPHTFSFISPLISLPAETLPTSACAPWTSCAPLPASIQIRIPSRPPEERRDWINWVESHAYPNNWNVLSFFTDGSATPQPDLTALTGMSWVAYWCGTELAHHYWSSSPHLHATDCELQAILGLLDDLVLQRTMTTAHRLSSTTQELLIFSDCLTALSLIHNPTRSPGLSTALSIRQHLSTLATRHPHLSITLSWCPGHENIVGNERADELARDAARQTPLHGSPSIRYLRSRAAQQAMSLWKAGIRAWRPSTTLSKRAKESIQGEPSNKPRPLLTTRAPRWLTARAHQLLMCAGRLGEYFVHRKVPDPPPVRCHHCTSTHPPLETRDHILLWCPALADLRARAWDGDPPTDISEWADPTHTSRLLWFIAKARPLSHNKDIEDTLAADPITPGPVTKKQRRNPALTAATEQTRAQFVAEGRALQGPLFDQRLFQARLTSNYRAQRT